MDTSEAPRKKHEDFWYEDGSIILEAESTLFRVHRSLLCAKSDVLKQILSIPMSTQVSQDEVMEGVPVVVMAGDTADNWNTVLLAIYEPRKLRFLNVLNEFKSMNLQVRFAARRAVGMLKIATKYHFLELRKDSMNYLSMIVPSMLTGTHHKLMFSLDEALEVYPSIVLAATQCTVPTLIPGALLILARSLRPNGEDDSRLLENDALPWDIKAKLLSGRTRLHYEARVNLDRSSQCCGPNPVDLINTLRNFKACKVAGQATAGAKSCDSGKMRLFKSLHDRMESGKLPLFESESRQILSWRDSDKTFLCSGCEFLISSELFEGRKTAWDKLPEYFGQGGSWEELRKDQEGWDAPDRSCALSVG